MHLKDTSNTLFFTFCSVEHIRSGIHCSRVNSEVSKFTYKRVRHDLEYKRWERLFIRRMSHCIISVHIYTLNSRNVKRWRHEFDYCVKKLLNTFVLVSCTAAYRNSSTFACRFSQHFLQLVYRRLFTFKVHHHKLVIQLADLLYEFCMIQLCVIFHCFRNLFDGDVISLVIVVDVSFHFKKIDDSFELVFFSDRKLKTNCVFT